jgi:hypothetical protein
LVARARGIDIFRIELTPTIERVLSIPGSLKESLKEYVPVPPASANAPLPPVTVTVALRRLTGMQVGLVCPVHDWLDDGSPMVRFPTIDPAIPVPALKVSPMLQVNEIVPVEL